MRAGTLNRRIDLLRAATTQNQYGEPVAEWNVLATVAARVEALEGKELYQPYPHPDATTRFTIRYRADLTTADRVRFDGRDYEIISVGDPTGARVQLILLAKERNATAT